MTPGDSFEDDILSAHNKYRSEVDVPPLSWSDNLAAGAQEGADYLAKEDRFEHSRSGKGENLFLGTAGFFSYTRMVDLWASEKEHFHPGIFPDISIDGEVVGHYTQIVWRNTEQLGCGGATGSDGFYRLVCRYDPPGNYYGQSVFLVQYRWI